jgi:Replication initiator protein A
MTHVAKQKRTKEKPLSAKDLVPLHIIRTETVLSKLPIHNLAKRGRINIHITKKNKEGEVDLLWDIAYTEKYGEPKQLAYRLDTLVVNRRIEEARRSGLPKVLRLGSLNELCKELERPPSGKNMQDLKRALLQNASAFVTAKLSYRGRDKRERQLEAGFSRYSVVFTGEMLPDGRVADAVYIILNDPFWEVLIHAQDRPLDYDYLKELKPVEQRFYEILSYRMFAALANQVPEAKLLYSEYCTFSAQQRHFDYDHFKKQMYKVHKTHLSKQYIAAVRYEATTDEDGRIDWQMSYTPGARAQAQFATFNPQRLKGASAERDEAPPPLEDQAAALVQLFYERFHNTPQTYPQPKELTQAGNLITRHGYERARYIVEYAHRAAAETKYRPQTFNGIMHYATPALANFEQTQKRQQAQAAIAACTYCNSSGHISFRKPTKEVFTAFCPHDAKLIEDRIQGEHLTHMPAP